MCLEKTTIHTVFRFGCRARTSRPGSARRFCDLISNKLNNRNGLATKPAHACPAARISRRSDTVPWPGGGTHIRVQFVCGAGQRTPPRTRAYRVHACRFEIDVFPSENERKDTDQRDVAATFVIVRGRGEKIKANALSRRFYSYHRRVFGVHALRSTHSRFAVFKRVCAFFVLYFCPEAECSSGRAFHFFGYVRDSERAANNDCLRTFRVSVFVFRYGPRYTDLDTRTTI